MDMDENGQDETTTEDKTEIEPSTPVRFLGVEGYDGRKNDVVYCMPAESGKPIGPDSGQPKTMGIPNRSQVLVFFGGDMQDFQEVMELHRENRQYSQWNLEATSQILQKQFPNHHVVVVKASRMHMFTYCCYDNFVHCNNAGAPDHVINFYALQHLEFLLKNLSAKIEKTALEQCEKRKQESEDSAISSTTDEAAGNTRSMVPKITSSSASKNPRLDRAKIVLIGFSKGCVVLNQLIYEFHYLKTLTPDDTSMDNFVKCLEDMYWLDAGHNGGKNTWITSRSLLETLTRLGVRVHVHVTPYQLNDERRVWIRKEEKLFSDMLKRFEAPITRHVHFENDVPSLDIHLQLIAQFGCVPETPATDSEHAEEEGCNDSSLSMGVDVDT